MANPKSKTKLKFVCTIVRSIKERFVRAANPKKFKAKEDTAPKVKITKNVFLGFGFFRSSCTNSTFNGLTVVQTDLSLVYDLR